MPWSGVKKSQDEQLSEEVLKRYPDAAELFQKAKAHPENEDLAAQAEFLLFKDIRDDMPTNVYPQKMELNPHASDLEMYQNSVPGAVDKSPGELRRGYMDFSKDGVIGGVTNTQPNETVSIDLNREQGSDNTLMPGSLYHEMAHAADRGSLGQYGNSAAHTYSAEGSHGENHFGYGLKGTLGSEQDLIDELRARHAMETRQPVNEGDLQAMPWLKDVKPIVPYAPVAPGSMPNAWSYYNKMHGGQ